MYNLFLCFRENSLFSNFVKRNPIHITTQSNDVRIMMLLEMFLVRKFEAVQFIYKHAQN